MKASFIIITVALFSIFKASAQGETDERAMIFRMKGLDVATKDSSFYANFRFRMQNRVGVYTTGGNDWSVSQWDARVRRLRLRVDGFMLTKDLGYSIQLSFSRGDQDIDNTGVANIIRDAVVFYHLNDKFYVAFGQNKLPGNRQQVNSSGQLQFAERSIVNSTFSIDRDFGLKAYYEDKVGQMHYRLKGAISTGDGRSVNATDNGLAYTGRIELLPLGDFKNGGDYSEGDLERETTPKLSVAGGYNYNHKATRTGGQRGPELYAPVNMGTVFFDMIFKYRGWAYATEYINRTSTHSVTRNADNDIRYVYTGWGINHQLSYLFKNNYEFAFRYSAIQPCNETTIYEDKTELLELGTSKYLRKHRIKAQLNFNYTSQNNNWQFNHLANRWGALFQIELGI